MVKNESGGFECITKTQLHYYNIYISLILIGQGHIEKPFSIQNTLVQKRNYFSELKNSKYKIQFEILNLLVQSASL